MGRDLDEAIAGHVAAEVLPYRTCHVLPDAHSLKVALASGLPVEAALTWDPAVADAVVAELDDLAAGRGRPDLEGCPDAS